MKRFLHQGLASVLLACILTRCSPTTASSPPEQLVPTPVPQATAASPLETPNPTPLAPEPIDKPAPQTEHRIGVRVVDGAGEFYDRETGDRFVPRGCSYVRVAPMSRANPGMWHSTLNPGLYAPERAEAALRSMHAAGYNTVRVFVDCCREGNNAGDPKGGLSLAYLENVIDFLKKAEANEVYVLIWESTADFVDLHTYLGGVSLEQYLDRFGVDGSVRKPIILGEF